MKKYLVLILLFLSSILFASGPYQSKKYFQNNGGLIDHISPLLIPENQASSLMNITMDDRGQLSKRSGYIILNSTGIMGTSAITGGGYHTSATGGSFFAVVSGTNVYRTGNTYNGTYTNITATTTITASNSNLSQTTSLNDTLIFCNEVDKPFKVGATGTAFQLATAEFTAAKTCSTYGVYLVVGNTTENATAFPSRVRWSDISSPDSFPDLNYIDVEPNDGDRIISMVSFDDSVYIFKHHSIYQMVITGSAGADAFIIRPVVRNMGAWAKNSVRVVPGQGVFFLAQNTLYQINASQSASYSGNGVIPVGDPIQRTFDGITRTMWANATAAVYPKKYQYWLSISTTSDNQNHEVLVYDYIQKAWTIYTGMNINLLSQAEDSNGNNLLLSGDYSGNLYKQDSGVSDNSLNISTSIAGSYTTADLILDTPEITKGFKYLYVFSQVDINTNLLVEGAFDYSTSYEYSSNLNLGQAGALYDTAIYDTDIYPATGYKVSRIELNRSARAIKLRFSNSSSQSIVGVIGWVLVYNLEDYKQ